MAKVIVVGAGIVGLLCAYNLRKTGINVLVLDKGRSGSGCSEGNNGWIVPSFSRPLPAPGLVRASLSLMLKPSSPLYVRPIAFVRLATWFLDFWRHCNPRSYSLGLGALARCNTMTLKLYEALANDGVVFEMHNSPILFLFLTRRAQAALLEDLELMTEYGYSSPHRLSAKDVRDLEPQVTNEVIGGVLSAGEAYLRPETLIAGLAERLTQSGVEIREGINVAGFRCHGRSVVALTTSSGELEGDQFLLTAGAWSGQLCRHLGIRIPIQGGKGYTITIADPIPSVNLPTYLEEAKVAYSPFSNALRIGGTMEFSVLDQSIDRRRIAAIKQSTTHFLRTWPTGSSERVWAGLRPLTPDGLPVVGQLPGYDNLFIAAGHGMLGVTLGPSTALAISQLMSRGASEFDIEVFSPSRFR